MLINEHKFLYLYTYLWEAGFASDLISNTFSLSFFLYICIDTHLKDFRYCYEENVIL